MSEKISISSKLRNIFVGAVMYSKTLNPYAQFGMGLVGLIQPINIPTPIDFLFYVGLICNGSKGVCKSIKSHFNGEARINKNKIAIEALQNLGQKISSHHIILN